MTARSWRRPRAPRASSRRSGPTPTGLPEIIETRDALETKIASLAASRRTEADLQRIEDALVLMEEDVAAGGRGVEGDEHFHAAVTAAAHSQLLSRLMGEIAHLIRETRIESLSQPGRPKASLAGHRAIADAIIAGDPDGAARAMHDTSRWSATWLSCAPRDTASSSCSCSWPGSAAAS